MLTQPIERDIPLQLDRRPVIWNYTLLKTYRDICQRQAALRYIEKIFPYEETEDMRWGNQVHKAFEKRLQRKIPLPDSMRQWEPFAAAFDGRPVLCEMQIGVDINFQPVDYHDKSGALYGRGKADVAVLSQDYTHAFLGDWKSGTPREEPFEHEVNAVLLKARYPQLQVIKAQYFWLKENRAGPVHDVSHVERTQGEIRRIHQMILNDRSTGHWPVMTSPLCKWCPDRGCEHNRRHELDG